MGRLQPVLRVFHVLRWAMTCSILHLIWSMARLKFLSASDRGRPGSFLTGGDQAHPDISFVRDVRRGGRTRIVGRGLARTLEKA